MSFLYLKGNIGTAWMSSITQLFDTEYLYGGQEVRGSIIASGSSVLIRGQAYGQLCINTWLSASAVLRA